MHNGSSNGELFFGHEGISALLEKRLDAFLKGYKQNIGIIAPPFFGKSSLTQLFLNRTVNSEVVSVYFPCQEFDSFERFSERWMGELLRSFYSAHQKPLPSNFQLLIRSLKGVIPKTLGRMKLVRKLVSRYRYDQAYQELMGLSGTLHQECGRKVLMVLDDFDRLGELALNDPFAALGKEIMIQKETLFIVTSSRRMRSQAIFREKLSLLFGNFEIVELGPFDFKEAEEFIKQRFPERILEDDLKRFLIRISDGFPYYLGILLNRLRLCFHKNEVPNRDLVTEALAGELYEDRGMLYQHFQSRLYQLAQGKPWPMFADILLAISLGHKKLSQITRFLHQKTSDVRKILEKLQNLEAVEKHGSLFQITDSLFRFWLSKVYYRQRFLIERIPLAHTQCFRDDVEKAIQESALADQRELPKRIEELFLKFHNDVVELNKRKFKCPHFTEVLSRPNNGRVFPVFARNHQTRWLCQVLSGSVTEEDIRTFLEDVKRLKTPVHKKLIVGLRGIDLNAKLLAQEAKIQYLDLRNFNFLLDLYGKPKIIF